MGGPCALVVNGTTTSSTREVITTLRSVGAAVEEVQCSSEAQTPDAALASLLDLSRAEGTLALCVYVGPLEGSVWMSLLLQPQEGEGSGLPMAVEVLQEAKSQVAALVILAEDCCGESSLLLPSQDTQSSTSHTPLVVYQYCGCIPSAVHDLGVLLSYAGRPGHYLSPTINMPSNLRAGLQWLSEHAASGDDSTTPPRCGHAPRLLMNCRPEVFNSATLQSQAGAQAPPDATLEGTLRCKRPGWLLWRRRWFALQAHWLTYYDRRGSSTPRGRIVLRATADVRRLPSPDCFQIVNAGHILWLRAGSADEAALWVDALTAAIEGLKAQDPGAPGGAARRRDVRLWRLGRDCEFTLPLKYEAVKHVSDGTYGPLACALNRDTGAKVAIRKTRTDLLAADEPFPNTRAAACLARELRLLRVLAPHPAIASLVDVPPPPARGGAAALRDLYSVTEWMDTDLRTALALRTLTEDHALVITHAVLSALAHMHAAGVAHRDLRPSRVLMNAAGAVKICGLYHARAFERATAADATADTPTPTPTAAATVDAQPTDATTAEDAAAALAAAALAPAAVSAVDFGGLTELRNIAKLRRPRQFLYCAPETSLADACGTAADVWAAGCIFAEVLASAGGGFSGALFAPAGDTVASARRVVEVLGRPSGEELSFVTNPRARTFAQSVPVSGPAPRTTANARARLAAVLPQDTSSEAAIVLLAGLLEFSPMRRLTAAAALKQWYLVRMDGPDTATAASAGTAAAGAAAGAAAAELAAATGGGAAATAPPRAPVPAAECLRDIEAAKECYDLGDGQPTLTLLKRCMLRDVTHFNPRWREEEQAESGGGGDSGSGDSVSGGASDPPPPPLEPA